MGFAPAARPARQLIRHRHIEVKQRILDVPSYQVRPGEEVRVKQSSRELVLVAGPRWSRRLVAARSPWIAWTRDTFRAVACSRSPHARRFRSPRRNSLVVELYSK
jgi:small subunit ribosomal protein S4